MNILYILSITNLVLIALKLFDQIDWAWAVVTIPLQLMVGLFSLVFLYNLNVAIMKKRTEKIIDRLEEAERLRRK